MIESIGPDVLLVVSPANRITSCNANILAVFGYTRSEVMHQPTDFLFSFSPLPVRMSLSYQHLNWRGFRIRRGEGIRKNNTAIYLEIISGELRRHRGTVMLIRDITSRKHAEEEMLRTQQELEQNYTRLKQLEEMRKGLRTLRTTLA
ncbi:MAG: PAS domain-containing protein [Candidatus Pacebacteria bacterium]|nr:PAS domain-containing protein [Candidatus Paceibacterota bacterium]